LRIGRVCLWEGNYTAPQFNITLYSGSLGFPSGGSAPNTVLVLDSMHLLVATYINMFRYTALQLDSANIDPANYVDCNRPIGIQTIGKNIQFNISPNPDQNLLTVNLLSPSAATTIAVYDVAGRKIILPSFFSNNKAELTTTTLPISIYLLQVINNITGVSAVGKFVKE
jgi:hypothetical protein